MDQGGGLLFPGDSRFDRELDTCHLAKHVRAARWRDGYFKGFLENADHLNELAHWDANQLVWGETASALRARVHGFYAAIAADLP